MAAGDSDLDRPGGLSLIAIQEFVRMDMSMTVSFRFQYVLRHWRFQAMEFNKTISSSVLSSAKRWSA